MFMILAETSLSIVYFIIFKRKAGFFVLLCVSKLQLPFIVKFVTYFLPVSLFFPFTVPMILLTFASSLNSASVAYLVHSYFS